MRQLVAMMLSAELGDHEDEEEDGYGIWPAQKKAKLLPVKLPDDLLFQFILVRLPFLRLLELRSVSRSWLSRLSSRDFWFLWFQFNPNSNYSTRSPNANTCRSTPNPDPNPNRNPNVSTYLLAEQLLELLILQDRCNPYPSRPIPRLLICSGVSLFGSALQWVKHRSIRYVREKEEMHTHRSPSPWFWLHENFLQVNEPYTILACEGGLFLLARHRDKAEQIIVCNPLLRVHKVLPNPIFSYVEGITMTGFITDIEHNAYTVILCDLACQVYCSKYAKWKLISRTLSEDMASVYPPMLEGSFFWVSEQPDVSNFCTLSAYHETEEVVTSVRMRFPHRNTSLKCGHIWKDSTGLYTLAVRSSCRTVLQIRVWQWGQEKYVQNSAIFLQRSLLVNFKYVKVGNLLYLRGMGNEIYISSLDLESGYTTPPCPLAGLADHYVLEPSYILV